jgi:hypothetical protein
MHSSFSSSQALLKRVIEDLLEKLNEFWDALPIDTVIASILDPRAKLNLPIPQEEQKEAISRIEKEFVELEKSTQKGVEEMEVEEKEKVIDHVFAKFSPSPRKMNAKQLWAKEWDAFKSRPAIGPSEDPLVWWKANEKEFPYLSESLSFFNFFFPNTHVLRQTSQAVLGHSCLSSQL